MRGHTLVRRLVAAAATVALFGAAVAVVAVVRHGLAEARAFHPERFKAAARRDDTDMLEDEAYAAVERRALLGLSEARVRALLGAPGQVQRRRHRYAWDIGMIHDTLGPGDQGTFYVVFDPAWKRVVATLVE